MVDTAIQNRRSPFRRAMAESQNWRCCYCGVRMEERDATFEHILPRCAGGSDEPDNLAIACSACNNVRGSQWWPVHTEVTGLPALPSLEDEIAAIAEGTKCKRYLRIMRSCMDDKDIPCMCRIAAIARPSDASEPPRDAAPDPFADDGRMVEL